MNVYYNDNDPYCAQWLRNLIVAGHLPKGEVDERPIQSVSGSDLGQFGQCHFFAGIGGWPYALKLAGWPESWNVFTGSCPCQPFSAAGKRLGTADERHLWPEFYRLISEHRPATVFGEQVASKAGREWLAGVRADLEALDYAVGAADLCAASAGAPHIRQRLWWVADSGQQRRQQVAASSSCDEGTDGRQPDTDHVAASYGEAPVWLADVNRTSEHERTPSGEQSLRDERGAACEGLGYTDKPRSQGRNERAERCGKLSAWSPSETIEGGRRIKPGLPLLAHGVSARMGKLRGFGNAIVPQVAAEVISAFMECQP